MKQAWAKDSMELVKMCAMQISQSCPTLFDNMFANYKSFGLLKIKFCII